MSRAAFIADVHGHLAALETVLRAIERNGVDSIFFLGDAVGYGPEGATVVRRLKDVGAVCLKGNHEAMLLGDLPPGSHNDRDAVYLHGRTRAEFDDETLVWVRNWPLRREIDLAGQRALLVHGSPANELTDYIYPEDELGSCSATLFDVIVTAHTHRPFVRTVDDKQVINVGSVGLPRDVGALAAFAVFDGATRQFSIRRIPLDTKRFVDQWRGILHPTVEAVFDRREVQFVGNVIHE